MTKHYFTWLFLGDSYTIGEAIPLHESYPYQCLQILRKNGLHFHAPEIVAKTGWTTLDLVDHTLHTKLNDSYDFVTLLIGVNNQYQGLDEEDYKSDFEFLLKKSIHFSDDKPDHVIVLSIPDWSITPFAANRDTKKIAKEIEAFNNINKRLAEQYKVHYINITESKREPAEEITLFAPDGLHFSKTEYANWANEIAIILQEIIE